MKNWPSEAPDPGATDEVEQPDVAGAHEAHQEPARRWHFNTQLGRLVSGLILFSFALTHFLNHALGLVDLDTMEAVQSVRRAIWRSPPGTVLLYGAFAVHITLGLWRLVRRATWRMPMWEAIQIGLGLLIPVWLIQHVIATRGMNLARGFDDTYSHELRILWPAVAMSQSALLLIVWVHATIGLHHWLRIRSWYRAVAPWLLGLAIVIPVLALAGWIEAARRVVEDAEGTQYPCESKAWADLARDQPRPRHTACLDLRRAGAMHHLPRAHHRRGLHVAGAKHRRRQSVVAHRRTQPRAARLSDQAYRRHHRAAARTACRGRGDRPAP
jgi:hypothetical protein